jgi:hypothetical protein
MDGFYAKKIELDSNCKIPLPSNCFENLTLFIQQNAVS